MSLLPDTDGPASSVHDGSLKMFDSTPPATTIRIFIDFDGTIVPQDVGNYFFEQFSGAAMWEDNRLYVEGAISAKELYERNTKRIEHIDETLLDTFCARFSIDAGFQAFLAWADEHQYPVLVLSDGLDAYIERIFGKAGLSVDFRANHLHIHPEGSCEVVLPSADEECTRCANCKRNHMLAGSGDKDVVVLIGDGISDFCPAQYADLVFAKGKLETWCQQQNIRFRRYDDFADILGTMERMISSRTLQRRGQTALRRAQIWGQG